MKKFFDTIRYFVLFFVLISTVVLPPGGFSQNSRSGAHITDQGSPVIIPNTEIRKLYSKVVDQEFNIYIQLPYSYFGDSTTFYPALYFTDANRAFPLVANISTVLSYPKAEYPEVIIIGIGYDIKSMEEWGAFRTRDLTPTNVPEVDQGMKKLILKLSGREIDVRSGGAEKFLDFIAKELIPFIESNYRVSKTDRTLGGYSFGGLFSLYALFKKPGIFNKYFAGSPSIYYDGGALFRYEEEYSQKNKDMNARLFLSVGGREDSVMVSDMKKMAAVLQSRNYPNLKIESHVFEDEDHRSCYAAAVMRAFITLYK